MKQSLKLKLSVCWLGILIIGLAVIGVAYPDFGKVYGMVMAVVLTLVCTWLSTFVLLDHYMGKRNPYG